MSIEENVEAAPSEDNGNIPLDTPSEPTTPETPAETVETPVEPVVELFELPDGRKVDAETLSKEFKENFLPEFTRKSQKLAELEKGQLPDSKPTQKEYEDPEWQPKTYAELIEIAKQEVKGDLEKAESDKVALQKSIEDAVVAQLTELKTADPTLNENALFLHANKYGFRDLKLAHQNMKDMSDTMKKVQSETVKNIAKRQDPVSVSPGATGAKPDPSQFSTAVEYVRSLK